LDKIFGALNDDLAKHESDPQRLEEDKVKITFLEFANFY